MFFCYSQNPPVAEWAPQDVNRSNPGLFLRKINFKSVAFAVSCVADILHNFTVQHPAEKIMNAYEKQKFFQ